MKQLSNTYINKVMLNDTGVYSKVVVSNWNADLSTHSECTCTQVRHLSLILQSCEYAQTMKLKVGINIYGRIKMIVLYR